MEYRRLGTTDMTVSRLGLGASSVGGIYGQVDQEEGVKVIQRALELGINFIDTAPWYGDGRSEEVLGQALKEVPRSSYYMGTKVGRYSPQWDKMFDFTAERTIQSVDVSLKRMGLEYVDLIQIHDVEFAPSVDIIVNETLPALQKVKESGKARYIGITGYPLNVLKEIVERSSVKIDTVLSYCRLSMNDSTLLGYLDFFKDKGIGVISASPLSMALLTHQGPPVWHPGSDEIKNACRNADKLCQERGVDLATLALDYSFSFTDIPMTLVGASSVDIVNQNVAGRSRTLTDTEKQTQQEIMDRFMKPLNNMNWEGVELDKYKRKLAMLRADNAAKS